MGFGPWDVEVSLGVRDSATLHSLCHVHGVLWLVDLSYVDWLAFTPPMVEVFIYGPINMRLNVS